MTLIGYWSRGRDTERNFGDALNPLLLEAISGAEVVHYDDAGLFKQRLSPVLYGMGSILERRRGGLSYRRRRIHVWGTGTRGEKSLEHLRGSTIHAVRGPLTQQALKKAGISCPDCFGDPALLLARLLETELTAAPTLTDSSPCVLSSLSQPIALVPHYVDRGHCQQWLQAHNLTDKVHVIDVFGDPIAILTAIRQSKLVLSSSLHGLILADAFSVPNARIKFSDAISGGDFKFNDYALSVDREVDRVVDLRGESCFARAEDQAEQGNLQIQDALSAAFPEELKITVKSAAAGAVSRVVT